LPRRHRPKEPNQGTQPTPADIEAKAQMCAACHGANGTPLDAKTMPNIWGQQPYYILTQLVHYRNGMRENPVMASIAKTLQQSDLRPLAAYFRRQALAGLEATRRPRPPRRPRIDHVHALPSGELPGRHPRGRGIGRGLNYGLQGVGRHARLRQRGAHQQHGHGEDHESCSATAAVTRWRAISPR